MQNLKEVKKVQRYWVANIRLSENATNYQVANTGGTERKHKVEN